MLQTALGRAPLTRRLVPCTAADEPTNCHVYPSSSVISSNPPEHGLVLNYGLFDVTLNWTVEPDVVVADTIALRHDQPPLTVLSYGSYYEIIFFSALWPS
jgi:hypothetical protein